MPDEGDVFVEQMTTISVPIGLLAGIHDLAESIINPVVTYSRDQHEMAKRVIEANAQHAAMIQERLPKHPLIQFTDTPST